MPSPWYSGKLTDSVPLQAGTATAFGEITVDEAEPDDWGLVVGNLRLRLNSGTPKKFDVWLDRVNADDQTCYNSHTFPGGDDDFYIWPVWLGELVVGETYRWWVRLESGLYGSFSTRYAKGIIVPRVIAELGLFGMDEVEKFGNEEVW